MSHNITERDGVFAVRDAMWHGLGTVLPDYPTRAEAQQLVHPWEPKPEPLFRRVLVPQEFGPAVPTYEKVPDFVANVRDDDGGLLGVVSKKFTVVKNGEMYDIAEAIEGEASGSVQYETGGSLSGGAKVWLLLRLRDPLVVNGDPNGAVIPYFALQNSHDGSGAFRGQATMTRIVCDNTAQMADLDAKARGTEFVFRHTSGVRERIDEARVALAGWRESVQAYRLLADHLVDTKVTPAQVTDFIEAFVPMPLGHTVSDRVVANVEQARGIIRDILASPTSEGIETTAYGLVQASVEYLNHARRAASKESRFKRAYLDRNTITSDALELALAVSKS